jgi:hypothetical protein
MLRQKTDAGPSATRRSSQIDIPAGMWRFIPLPIGCRPRQSSFPKRRLPLPYSVYGQRQHSAAVGIVICIGGPGDEGMDGPTVRWLCEGERR